MKPHGVKGIVVKNDMSFFISVRCNCMFFNSLILYHFNFVYL